METRKVLRNMHRKVAREQANGVDVRWNGWDVIYFYPNPKAEFDTSGVWRNGSYGYQVTLTPDRQGIWNKT